MKLLLANNFVQATPVLALLSFLSQQPGAPDDNRWATMRSSLLLIFLGCSIAMSQTNQTTQNNPADAGRQLRMMMLTTSAKGVSIQPTKSFPRVFGVLMDWPLGPQTVTVVSLCDGTASICTTSTFGVIGGIGHESVRSAAVQFVSAAEKHHDSAAPTKEYPYPKPGRVRFYLVCFDGVRVIDEDEVALKTGKDACSVRCFHNLFHASSGDRACTAGYFCLNSVSESGPTMDCLATSMITQPSGSPRYVEWRLAKINPLVQAICSTVPSMQPPPVPSAPAFSK